MTDKERIEILKTAKENIRTNKNFCICPVLQILANIYDHTGYGTVRKLFPELIKHKPKSKNINEAWWDINNIAVRLKVLNSMIKEIKSNQ